MPALDPSLLSHLQPWQQYSVFVCINMVVMVMVAGLCACCYGNSKKQSDAVEEVGEEEEDEFDAMDDVFSSISKSAQRPLLARKISGNTRPDLQIKNSGNQNSEAGSLPEWERATIEMIETLSDNEELRRGSETSLMREMVAPGAPSQPSIVTTPISLTVDLKEHSIQPDVNNITPRKPLKKHSIQPDVKDISRKKSLKPRSASLPALPAIILPQSSLFPTNIPHSPGCPGCPKRNENLGKIFFNISYVKQVLVLMIEKGVDLPVNDMNGSSDPYVKIFLLPDKKQKFETRIVKRNLNPVWNETFRFEGFPEGKLRQCSLYLQVLDYDRFTKDDVMGEVKIELRNIILQPALLHLEERLKPSTNTKGGSSNLGSLLVSMCYDRTKSSLAIVVMKGSRMRTTDATGKSDPFVKVHLMYMGKKLDKKKTPIVKRSLNPVWNHVMEFEDVTVDKLRGISIVFTVMDFDALLPNDYVGKVIVGSSTTGTSLQHWKDVMTNPGKAIAQWHRIVKY